MVAAARAAAVLEVAARAAAARAAAAGAVEARAVAVLVVGERSRLRAQVAGEEAVRPEG
jgi:hypothetical protein